MGRGCRLQHQVAQRVSGACETGSGPSGITGRDWLSSQRGFAGRLVALIDWPDRTDSWPLLGAPQPGCPLLPGHGLAALPIPGLEAF
jgi:hypothetical protein